MQTAQMDPEQYRNDGFILPLEAMSAETAKYYRDRVEALETEWRERKPRGELNQYFRVNAHYVLPLAVELATQKPVLDAVEAIIGRDILVWSCELFIKEAGSTKIVSWHQDMTYWGLGEETDGDTEDLVTAWIALSPANQQSGCMKFVAGSHREQIIAHKDTFSEDNLLSRGQELAVEVNEADATHVVLEPGQFSLHHGRMFHGSGPNVSDDRRIGIAIRYVTPNIRQLVGQRDYAMLVRGCDRQQNWIHVAPPQSDFEEAQLDLYDKILSDQLTALAAGASENVGLYGAN